MKNKTTLTLIRALNLAKKIEKDQAALTALVATIPLPSTTQAPPKKSKQRGNMRANPKMRPSPTILTRTNKAAQWMGNGQIKTRSAPTLEQMTARLISASAKRLRK